MATSTGSFRVCVFLRGCVWYLSYQEDDQRCQLRVGPDPQLAAEINGPLEVGDPRALGFQPISGLELRRNWLEFHKPGRRSALAKNLPVTATFLS